ILLARRVGFEPTTNRLTADRSATELPPNAVRREPGSRQRHAVYQSAWRPHKERGDPAGRPEGRVGAPRGRAGRGAPPWRVRAPAGAVSPPAAPSRLHHLDESRISRYHSPQSARESALVSVKDPAHAGNPRRPPRRRPRSSVRRAVGRRDRLTTLSSTITGPPSGSPSGHVLARDALAPQPEVGAAGAGRRLAAGRRAPGQRPPGHRQRQAARPHGGPLGPVQAGRRGPAAGGPGLGPGVRARASARLLARTRQDDVRQQAP